MNDLDIRIKKLQRDMGDTQRVLEQVAVDLTSRENEVQKSQEYIIKQRADIIAKQNTILSQVDSMRDDRTNAEVKLKQAEKIRQSMDVDHERLQKLTQDIERREIDLDIREKKITALEKLQSQLKEKEESLLNREAIYREKNNLLVKSQELLEDKKASLDMRTRKIEQQETRLGRISDMV